MLGGALAWPRKPAATNVDSDKDDPEEDILDVDEREADNAKPEDVEAQARMAFRSEIHVVWSSKSRDPSLMKPLALTLEKESTHTLRNKIRLPLDVSKGKSSWLTKAIFTLEKLNI